MHYLIFLTLLSTITASNQGISCLTKSPWVVYSYPYINNIVSDSVNTCIQEESPWYQCDNKMYCNSSDYGFRSKTLYFEYDGSNLKVSFDEIWALQCNSPIYDDREHIVVHQEGTGVVEPWYDYFNITLTVTSGCDASWITNKDMCSGCTDSCDLCNGYYYQTCFDYNTNVPFEPQCPDVCDAFELGSSTMYTIMIINNCSSLVVVESRSLLDTELFYKNSAEKELCGMMLILLFEVICYIFYNYKF
jgi:hypothetical protein